MCGIVGVVIKARNGFTKKVEDTFFQMLYVDGVRGMDSTGIIAVENDNAFHIAKEAMPPEYFSKEFKTLKGNIYNNMYAKGKVYIGHNRKKTIGAISDATAHPFVVKEKMAMVHNGTLLNHYKLAQTSVDSEALAIHLQKALEGAKEPGKAVEAALGDVEGAYAVAIYDQEKHQVYLLRNKERPLAIIETDDAWYFMSESLMGAWILSRNEYAYSKLKVEYILEHQLITFDLNENTLTKEILSPKKVKLPLVLPKQDGSSIPNGWTENGNRGKPCIDAKDFKKFSKDWVGKRVSFWVDDFIEKNFPKTVEQDGESEIRLIGQVEDVPYWHSVLADVNLNTLGIKYAEDIGAAKWNGIVEAVSHNGKGTIFLELQDGCKPMVHSLSNLETIKKLKNFRKEIEQKTEEELCTYEEENKHTIEPWQKQAIVLERTFRASIESIEDAYNRAKALDYTLSQVKKGDHYVYVNSEGRVFYESTVTIH